MSNPCSPYILSMLDKDFSRLSLLMKCLCSLYNMFSFSKVLSLRGVMRCIVG